MRLIDADELLIMETVAYNKAQTKINDKATRLVNEAVHKKIQMLVSDTQTAYDTDKVVEKLEQMRDLNYNVYQEYEDYINCGKMMGYEEAIEIVKEGGVE